MNGFVVKTLSRHQQMISLSSMESELFALQHVAQETYVKFGENCC